MATTVDRGPSDGLLVKDADGQHYEVQGNKITPVEPQEAEAGSAAAGGGSDEDTGGGDGVWGDTTPIEGPRPPSGMNVRTKPAEDYGAEQHNENFAPFRDEESGRMIFPRKDSSTDTLHYSVLNSETGEYEPWTPPRFKVFGPASPPYFPPAPHVDEEPAIAEPDDPRRRKFSISFAPVERLPQPPQPIKRTRPPKTTPPPLVRVADDDELASPPPPGQETDDDRRNPPDYEDYGSGARRTRGVVQQPDDGVVVQDKDGNAWHIDGNNVAPVGQPGGRGGARNPARMLQPMLKGANPFNTPGYRPVAEPDSGPATLFGARVWTPEQPMSPEAALSLTSHGPLTGEAADALTSRQPESRTTPSNSDGDADPINAPLVDKYGSGTQPAPTPAATPSQLGAGGSSGGSSSAPQVDTRDYDDAIEDEQNAARREGAAKAEAARKVGAFENNAANEAKQRLDTFNENRARQQAEGARQIADMNAEIDKIGTGTQQVDPDHFWKSRSTGGKVAGMISMVLGGFAQGYGVQGAGKVISDAIEQDNAAQRFNIETANSNQKAKVAAKSTVFDHWLAQTGNANAAEAAANAWGYDAVKQKVEAMKSSLSAPAEIAAADQLIAQFGQKKAAYQMQAKQFATAQKTAQFQQQGMALDNEGKRLQMQAARAAQASGVLRPAEVSVNGRRFNVGNEKIAAKLDDAKNTALKMKHAIGVMREAASEGFSGSDWVNPRAAGRYQAALDTFQTLVNKGEGVDGVVGAQQRELYEQALHNNKLLPNTKTLASLQVFEDGVVQNVSQTFGNRGLPSPLEAGPTEAQQAKLAKAGR